MDEKDLTRLNDKPFFTILIIDDMDNMRQGLIDDLRSLQFEGNIIEAENIKQANECLNSKHFDLVLCDRNLPDGSGVGFISALREHPRLSKTPLIMCTTVDEPVFVIYAIKQGANEYLVKPWEKEDLLKKILSVVPTYKK
jgi:twitching motility two-component system response regulator PilH